MCSRSFASVCSDSFVLTKTWPPHRAELAAIDSALGKYRGFHREVAVLVDQLEQRRAVAVERVQVISQHRPLCQPMRFQLCCFALLLVQLLIF